MATRKNKTSKKATTEIAPAKKKKMEYADGKSHDIQKARDIEELLTVDRKNPFRTRDGSDFEENLSSMSLSDMQELAVAAGIFPSGTKTTLKNKILKEYNAKAIGKKRKGQVTRPSIDPKSKQADDLLRLLNE